MPRENNINHESTDIPQIRSHRVINVTSNLLLKNVITFILNNLC